MWNAIEEEMDKRYLIVCGDFNAKIAGYWSNTSNLGGEMIQMIVDMAGMEILNSKEEPTRRE